MGEEGKSPTAATAASRSAVFLEDHGYLLLLAVALVMLVAAIVLSAQGRDANFLIAGGSLLAFLGVDAGRLIKIEAGTGGVKVERAALAQTLRRAAEEQADVAPASESGPDAAEVLSATAAVLEARTDAERKELVQQLEGRVVSPFERLRLAEKWVIDLEEAAGRSPTAQRDRFGPDIESPPRRIELRVLSSLAQGFFALTQRDVDAAEDPNFFIYLIEMPTADPHSWSLRVLDQPRIRGLLDTASKTYRLRTRDPIVQTAPGIEGLSDAGGSGASD